MDRLRNWYYFFVLYDSTVVINISLPFLPAWVKDSGDDWSPSSSSESSQEGSDGEATDVIYEVEYEVASDSNNDQGNDSSSGDSDIEVILNSYFKSKFPNFFLCITGYDHPNNSS